MSKLITVTIKHAMTFAKIYRWIEPKSFSADLFYMEYKYQKRIQFFPFWCLSRLLAKVIPIIVWALSWDAYLKLIIILSQ